MLCSRPERIKFEGLSGEEKIVAASVMLVVWGWSVNGKKARLRDVGVVKLKDTPRKVV